LHRPACERRATLDIPIPTPKEREMKHDSASATDAMARNKPARQKEGPKLNDEHRIDAPAIEKPARRKSRIQELQPGFGEPDVPRLKKPFVIGPTQFSASHAEPDRIDNELAVRVLSTLVDDHFRPPSLEVHVLTDFEFRLGGCCWQVI
jgi:hypothetical protein